VNEAAADWTAELARRGWVVIPLRRGKLIVRMAVIVGASGTIGWALVSAIMGVWSWDLWELVGALGRSLSAAMLGLTVSILITWPRRLVVDATGIRLGRWRARWADVERIDVRHSRLGFTSVIVKPRRGTASKRVRVLSDQLPDPEGIAGWLRFMAGAYGAPLGGGAQPLPPV
jgi:hypothetical protein